MKKKLKISLFFILGLAFFFIIRNILIKKDVAELIPAEFLEKHK